MHLWTEIRVAAAILLTSVLPAAAYGEGGTPGVPAAYSLDIALFQRGEVLSEYELIVEPGKGYLLTLPGREADVVVLDVAADTRAAAYSAFERDLGPQAGAHFVHITASLELAQKEASGLVFAGEAIGSGLLLPLTGRPVRAEVPAYGDDPEAPQFVAQLTIRASARPWNGPN